jgi:amino acid transporter
VQPRRTDVRGHQRRSTQSCIALRAESRRRPTSTIQSDSSVRTSASLLVARASATSRLASWVAAAVGARDSRARHYSSPAGARLGAFWGDSASLLFAASLFAALLSFHNAVARYTFALGRERVLPRAFSRVQAHTGAPYIASLTRPRWR